MLTSSQKGITLIELMIVVAIVAILAGLAYPSYTKYVQKSRRAEAQAALQELAVRQERWRAGNATYGTLANLQALSPALVLPTDYYAFGVVADAFTYSITADATGGQDSDSEDGVDCELAIDQSGNKTPPACW